MNTLIILDEAEGVPYDVWESALRWIPPRKPPVSVALMGEDGNERLRVLGEIASCLDQYPLPL